MNKHTPTPPSEAFPQVPGLSASDTCADEAYPSSAPFKHPDDIARVETAFCMSESRGFLTDEPRHSRWREVLADLIGAACILFLLYAGLFIGAAFQ